MKIYITGPVGSGKSTLADRLAAATGTPCFHLDEVVHEPDPAARWGNRRRPEAERDARFASVLALPAWIVEDAGRACFAEGLRQAGRIVLLDPPPLVRRARIVRRWLRQRRGAEPCLYRPGFFVLRAMFRWSRAYERGEDGLRARLAPFAAKTVVLRTGRETEAFLKRAADVTKN